jgi:hypothetical protein
MDALPDDYYPVEPLTQQCVEEVIQESGIHPDVLFAIMMVEGGTVGEDARRQNSNGTYDIGLMQINSIHLPELAKLGISISSMSQRTYRTLQIQMSTCEDCRPTTLLVMNLMQHMLNA